MQHKWDKLWCSISVLWTLYWGDLHTLRQSPLIYVDNNFVIPICVCLTGVCVYTNGACVNLFQTGISLQISSFFRLCLHCTCIKLAKCLFPLFSVKNPRCWNSLKCLSIKYYFGFETCSCLCDESLFLNATIF